MKRQRNDFTNHEVEIIRKHWPTEMPIPEILAMLPRHTYRSVIQIANAVLRLRRPPIKGSPAWDRVCDLLKVCSMTRPEIARAMGISEHRVWEIMRPHRDEFYIKSWKSAAGKGRPSPRYDLGNKVDVPMPARQRRRPKPSIQRHVNPFLAAAGMIEAPIAAETGRVYKQAMEVDEEQPA